MADQTILLVRVLRTWARIAARTNSSVASAKRDILLELARIAAQQRDFGCACDWVRSSLEPPALRASTDDGPTHRAAHEIGENIDRAIALARPIGSARRRTKIREFYFPSRDPVLRLVRILRKWSLISRLTERHQCSLPADELLRLAGIAAASSTFGKASYAMTAYLRQRSLVSGPGMGGTNGAPIRATAVALLGKLPRVVAMAKEVS